MTAHIKKPRRSILKLENRQSDGGCMRKKVFFDEIRIQEYPIILGDNPAVYVFYVGESLDRVSLTMSS